MITLSQQILSMTESTREIVIGDIIDTSSVNFDPVKAVGRIRDQKEDGTFTVEYPDGILGVLVAPEEIHFLDDYMYKKYIESARKESENDPELIAKIIKKVNHWIRKKKKSLPFQKHWEKPMTEARRVLDLLEGFVDAVPSTAHREGGERELWLPIEQPVNGLSDKDGNEIPSGISLALNVSGIGRFAEIGELEDNRVGKIYTVSIQDLKNSGIFVK